MKRVLTASGGHFVKNTDIQTVQENVFLAASVIARAIAQATGITQFVVSGCVPSIVAGNIVVSPGYVYIDNEVFEYLGSTATYNSSYYYYLEVQSQTTNPRQYNDTTVHDTLENRQVILSLNSSIVPNTLNVQNAPLLENLIQQKSLDKLGELEADWIDIASATVTLDQSGYTFTNSLLISYKTIHKTCILTGTLSLNITAASVFNWQTLTIDLPITPTKNAYSSGFWGGLPIQTKVLSSISKLTLDTFVSNSTGIFDFTFNIQFPIS